MQLSLFEEAQLKAYIGQTVYLIILDEVIETTVAKIDDHNEDPNNPYYVYWLKDVCIFNSRVNNFMFDKRVFLDKEKAVLKCKDINVRKINIADLQFTDVHAYKFKDRLNDSEHKAFIAKVEENQFFIKDFYGYNFLKIYNSSKERDKEYDKALGEIIARKKLKDAEFDSEPQLKDLYYVDETLFACKEYAQRHTTAYYNNLKALTKVA